MANEVIKKVIVPSQELPDLQFTTIKNPAAANRDEIDELYHEFRYRIASQDKNRTSSWSPIERVIVPNLKTPFPYTANTRINISKAGNPEVVTTIWSLPTDAELQALVDLLIADPENPNGITAETANYIKLYRQTTTYDVWIRWTETNNADASSSGWTPWQFETTVSSNSFPVAKPLGSSYKTVEVAVQITTTTKLRDFNNNRITLFKNFGAV
jgi:hypothetical protein